jgi:transposase
LEVMCGLISMRVELGLEKSERLESLVEGQQVRYILPPMRLETRLILKSLGWAKGARAIILRRVNSTKENLGFDDYIYKQRHLVESLFAKLKHYRSIATRFEKLAKNFRSIIFIACSIIWLKLNK